MDEGKTYFYGPGKQACGNKQFKKGSKVVSYLKQKVGNEERGGGGGEEEEECVGGGKPSWSKHRNYFLQQHLLQSALSSVQFSSVQGGINALGKAHMRSTPSPGTRFFPPVFSLKQFQCWSDSQLWPFLVLSRKIVERFLLSTPLFSRRSMV